MTEWRNVMVLHDLRSHLKFSFQPRESKNYRRTSRSCEFECVIHNGGKKNEMKFVMIILFRKREKERSIQHEQWDTTTGNIAHR